MLILCHFILFVFINERFSGNEMRNGVFFFHQNASLKFLFIYLLIKIFYELDIFLFKIIFYMTL